MSEIKVFSFKITKELWSFLKMKSVEEEVSMGEIICKSLENMKKRKDKKLLTHENINI